MTSGNGKLDAGTRSGYLREENVDANSGTRDSRGDGRCAHRYRRTANAQAKLEGRSVKIGCLAPLTGKGAEWGQAAKPSMEIAAEEINAKGGIGGVPIELICYDTQTLEAEALKAMSRLVDRDKVLVISGPCFSGEFETIAPQLDSRFKTVINSYCSAKPGLSAMSKWAFRNTLTSDKQLKPVVEAWVEGIQAEEGRHHL